MSHICTYRGMWEIRIRRYTNKGDYCILQISFILMYLWYYRGGIFLVVARGLRFNFLLAPRGGRGEKRRKEGKRKKRIWGQIFEFWRHIFEFWRCIFEFWRHIFECWRQKLKIESFRGVFGGVGGAPRSSGRFMHRCREKIFRISLDISQLTKE